MYYFRPLDAGFCIVNFFLGNKNGRIKQGRREYRLTEYLIGDLQMLLLLRLLLCCCGCCCCCYRESNGG